MGLRDKLNRAKPMHVAIGAGLCMAVAAYVIWSQTGAGPSALGGAVVLKCAKPECARPHRMSLGDAMRQATVDDLSGRYPAAKCPACGEDRLAYAWECPSDHTVFFRVASNAPEGERKTDPRSDVPPVLQGTKCPQCGWDPAAEEREKLAKALGRPSR